MDTYCINRGRLLDKPDLGSLTNPDEHSVHCLVDIPICYDGGFELLMDPVFPESTHCRAYTLDDIGRDMVLDHARAIGDCDTCGGMGMQAKGYRATVTGKVYDMSSKTPTLYVTTVEDSAVGCPTGATVPNPEQLDCTSGKFQPWIVTHGTLMMMGWGILLPIGVIIARLFKHKKPEGLWFKIHKICQISGLIISLIGWIIALVQFDVFSAGAKDNVSYIHGLVGSLVMLLGLLQPLNAFIRPHAPGAGDVSKSTARHVWEYVHKGSGYTAVILSVIAIAIGVTRPARQEVQIAFQIVYALVLLCLITLIALLWFDRRQVVHNTDCNGVAQPKSAADQPL